MNSKEIFGIALGLEFPWEIQKVELRQQVENDTELHITIGFERGSKFTDEQGNVCSVHDTIERSWQHLHFFQHKCFIHCKVPRIIHRDGKVRQVALPWARSGSGFTLLFEAFAMALIEGEMPVNKAARLLGIYPQRLWNIFAYWISIAYSNDDPSGIRYLGIDETSAKKGHDYVTIAADLEVRRIVHVVGGKDKGTIHSIRKYLERKHVKAEQIEQTCMDMSPAYIGGVVEEFPKAQCPTSIIFSHQRQL
jgi:transposase